MIYAHSKFERNIKKYGFWSHQMHAHSHHFDFLEFATHYHSHLRLCGSQLAKLEVVMCHGNACCRIDGFLQAASLGSRARSTYWDTWNDHELQLLIFLQSTRSGFPLCNDHYMSLRPSDCRLGHFPRPHMSLSHMVPPCIFTTRSVEKSEEVHCFLPLNIAVCCFDFSGSGAQGWSTGWLEVVSFEQRGQTERCRDMNRWWFLQGWDFVGGSIGSIISRHHKLGPLGCLSRMTYMSF